MRRKNFMEGHSARPEEREARQRAVEALFEPRLAQKKSIPQDLPLERIDPNPFQARKTFSEEGLAELAEAIRAQGFTSRLRVRPHPERDGRFQLVYGERRLRAAGLAGLTVLPCEIAEHTDDDLIEIGLAENIQRQDLTPLEEGQAFQQFIEQRNYSVRRLAERIGKDKGYIQNRISLLQTPPDVQALIEARPDTISAAIDIAKLPAVEERKELIEKLLSGELTGEATREKVRQRRQGGAVAREATLSAPLEKEMLPIRRAFANWKGALLSGALTHAELAPYLSEIHDAVEELQAPLED